VSEPTVRKWLAEGLLERVEAHKPMEIAQRSVIEVERVLGTIRESYPAPRRLASPFSRRSLSKYSLL
jgi:hypothetical protein